MDISVQLKDSSQRQPAIQNNQNKAPTTKQKNEENKVAEHALFLENCAIEAYGQIIKKLSNDLDLTKFKIVIDALEFAMVLFGGYVFGGKIVDIFKILRPNTEIKK